MRRRSAGGFAFLLLALLLSPALLAGEPARVESTMNVQEKAWVGQKLILHVELMGAGQFAGTPGFAVPNVSGLVILKVPGRPVLGTRTVGGTSYTTQRHEFFVFAQRPGRWEIPAFPVRFGTKAAFNADPVEHSLQTEAHGFEAVMPPGAENLGTLISARSLTLEEKWEPEPADAEAEVGGAFTRTLIFTAPDVPAMAFPPLPLQKMPGLGVYPGAPEVLDTAERGAFKGKRVDTVTYVCERPGEYRVPALVFHWWNLDSEKLERIELPAVIFVVTKGAFAEGAADEEAEETGPAGLPWWLIGLGVLIACAGAAGWIFRERLNRAYRDWMAARAERESAYVERLLKACDTNDPGRTYRALIAWMNRRYAAMQAVTLSELARLDPDPDLIREARNLEAALIGRSSGWSGTDLKKALSGKRRVLKLKRNAREPLPALNPLWSID
jgi:hypothetical protein